MNYNEMTNIGAKEANYHSLIRISLLRFLSTQ